MRLAETVPLLVPVEVLFGRKLDEVHGRHGGLFGNSICAVALTSRVFTIFHFWEEHVGVCHI